MQRLLTVAEAAEALGLKPATIWGVATPAQVTPRQLRTRGARSIRGYS